jgi:hypothetical protein
MADQQQKYREIIARAWKDEDFKQKLISNPKKVFGEAGVSFPANLNVNVHVDTPEAVHFVIPRNPAESELSDEALNAASGGSGAGDTCYQTCYLINTCSFPC